MKFTLIEIDCQKVFDKIAEVMASDEVEAFSKLLDDERFIERIDLDGIEVVGESVEFCMSHHFPLLTPSDFPEYQDGDLIPPKVWIDRLRSKYDILELYHKFLDDTDTETFVIVGEDNVLLRHVLKVSE